jgi:hypothetical protein
VRPRDRELLNVRFNNSIRRWTSDFLLAAAAAFYGLDVTSDLEFLTRG